MAQAIRIPFFVRFLNPVIKGLIRVGLPIGPMILLTVRGRTTGEPRTTPVGLFELDGHQYLFSTFGQAQWVRNLRAAGGVVLTRGRWREAIAAIELSPEEAAPVLKDVLAPYLASPLMRSVLHAWYDVAPDTHPENFINVARQHPVFEVRQLRSWSPSS